jgi:hypothetical protein
VQIKDVKHEVEEEVVEQQVELRYISRMMWRWEMRMV